MKRIRAKKKEEASRAMWIREKEKMPRTKDARYPEITRDETFIKHTLTTRSSTFSSPHWAQGEFKSSTDSMQLLLEILLLILKCIYYICESLYRFFIPMEKKNVAGEVVLITGAGGGIGTELAKGYASLGATVVCLDINKETNEQTMNEIKKMGFSAYAYKCDISDLEEVLNVAEKVKKDVGDVTILINNAAIAPVRKFLNYSNKEITRVMKINVLAHYWILKAFLPGMLEKNHGHIVTISSIAAFIPGCHATTYSPSKSAVAVLTNNLRYEIDTYRKQGNSLIQFTTIYPSFTNTPLVKNSNLRFPNFIKLQSPQKVAATIIDAQRRNYTEKIIPSYFIILIRLARCLPQKAQDAILNFLNIDVKEDDEDPSKI